MEAGSVVIRRVLLPQLFPSFISLTVHCDYLHCTSTIHTYIDTGYIPICIPFARFEAFDIINLAGGIPLLQPFV